MFLSLWELPRLLQGSKAGMLLRDWRFSQLAAFRAGFPYSVNTGSAIDEDAAGRYVNILNPRASLIDPARVELSQPVLVPGGKRLLNESAFTIAAPNRLGSTGRNAFRGPGLYNIDISLSRSFPLRWIGEAGRLTFRADAFNILNHANLNNPESLLGDANFGVAFYGRQGKQSGFPAVTPFNETARQVQLIFRVEF